MFDFTFIAGNKYNRYTKKRNLIKNSTTPIFACYRLTAFHNL